MSWWIPVATMLGSAALSSNQQASRPVRAGNQHLLGNRPVISLSPNASLMTMPPIGYQASSTGNNIPAAVLDQGGSAPTDAMRMDRVNLTQMGNKATSEEKPDNEVVGTGALDDAIANKGKTDIEVQKIADRNALIRQGISSAGTLLGTLMRPPSAVTVGANKKNPPLQMFRRRRGLMGG